MPGVLQFMGSQIVGHDWATELNWGSKYVKGKINSSDLKKRNKAPLRSKSLFEVKNSMVGFNSRWDKVDETLRICKLKERSEEITQDKAQSERECMKELQELGIERTDVIRVPEKAGKEGAEAIHEERSVQFSHSVVTDSLRPHELHHARPPCPSPIPRVHPNPCPSSRWCHPTISSSVVSFSSCPQSFPASGSFQMNQLFASGAKVLEYQL